MIEIGAALLTGIISCNSDVLDHRESARMGDRKAIEYLADRAFQCEDSEKMEWIFSAYQLGIKDVSWPLMILKNEKNQEQSMINSLYLIDAINGNVDSMLEMARMNPNSKVSIYWLERGVTCGSLTAINLLLKETKRDPAKHSAVRYFAINDMHFGAAIKNPEPPIDVDYVFFLRSLLLSRKNCQPSKEDVPTTNPKKFNSRFE